MLTKISNHLAGIVAKKCEKEHMQDIYRYALELVLSSAIGYMAILFIAGTTLGVKSGILFIIFYSSLRIFVGGYHAETYLKCFIVSCVSFVFVMMIDNFITVFQINRYYIYLVALVSILYVLFRGPKIHPNQILSKARLKQNTCASYIVITVDIVIMTINLNVQIFDTHMVELSIILVAIFMLYSDYINIKGRRSDRL